MHTAAVKPMAAAEGKSDHVNLKCPRNLEKYPGEDISSAAELRRMFRVPLEQETVSIPGVGTTWYRWFNSGLSKTPIVICIGGTGTAVFYVEFAQKLARLYGGPVLIWDRVNMGLSDRKPGRTNDFKLWNEQIAGLLDALKLDRVHMVGFSLAGLIVPAFHAAHPQRINRIAVISAFLGGAGNRLRKTFRKLHMLPRCYGLCCCPLPGLSTALTKRYAIPVIYRRSEEQIEEGADPSGLPIAKAMYRVKHTARAWHQQQTNAEMRRFVNHGAFDLCKALNKHRVAVYARNYEQDDQVDLAQFQKAWDIISGGSGHPDCVFEMGQGLHHKFYEDETAERLAHFFQQGDAAPDAHAETTVAADGDLEDTVHE